MVSCSSTSPHGLQHWIRAKQFSWAHWEGAGQAGSTSWARVFSSIRASMETMLVTVEPEIMQVWNTPTKSSFLQGMSSANQVPVISDYFFPLYYTYENTIKTYYNTNTSLICNTVFRLLFHIISNSGKQLKFTYFNLNTIISIIFIRINLCYYIN